MAYKFFSQKVLENSEDLDLTQVFPQKQEMAREQNNVTYTLLDIVIFLRDRTENFKFSDAQYVDLDNAIAEIINRYYKSENIKNPFTKEEVDLEALEEFEGKLPKEAFIAKDGEVKGKGVVKPAPSIKKKKEEVEVVVQKAPEDKIEKIKRFLLNSQGLIDNEVLEGDEITELLSKLKKQNIGYMLLDEPEYLEMAKLNEEFINKNTK